MGFATADMADAIDSTVGNYVNPYGIPGGAVAITHKNQLIFAKSYGYIDVGKVQFAEPDSRFRTASVSKPITAMAVLKLVHDGHISPADHPFSLSGVGSVIGGPYNSALSAPSGLTIDDLLQHTGSWDRNVGPDLEGYNTLQTIAGLLKSAGPPDCTTLLRYVESQPSQFIPGTEAHYSNIGFCSLSEVIREKSGTSFFDYLNANMLVLADDRHDPRLYPEI